MTSTMLIYETEADSPHQRGTGDVLGRVELRAPGRSVA